jgi:hypothetical protein
MTTSSRPGATGAATDPATMAVTDAAEQGAEGNSRLTSVTGALLLVMLAVEGVTVLDVRGLITLHVYLGIMLLGPVALKIAATLYRFVRYYTSSPAYVRRGPPHVVLRVLGPLVTLTSVALLGTGVALLAVRPGDGTLLLAHKASFILWFAVMTVHVLGHLGQSLRESWLSVRQLSRAQAIRFALVAASLVLGVGLAAALLPTAGPWLHRPADVHQQDGLPPR